MINIRNTRFNFFLNKEFLNIAIALKKPQFCYGLKNQIDNFSYVPFFDFDNTDYLTVEAFSQWLYYFYDSKYGYTILQSSDNGYHVILWKVVVRDMYLHLLINSLSYGLDKGYIQVFLSRGFSVLRISGKGNKPIPRVIEYKKGYNDTDEEVMKKLFEANHNLILYTTFKY